MQKERQKRREAAVQKGKDLNDKIHANKLEAYALQALFGANADADLPLKHEIGKRHDNSKEPSSTSNNQTNRESIDDEMFKLPPLQASKTTEKHDSDESVTVCDEDENDGDDDICILDEEHDGVALTTAELHADLRSRLELYLDV